MEVTDMSHLMSLIESGTVSIICNPEELDKSSNETEDAVLTSQATISATNSLTDSLIVEEDCERNNLDSITSPCSSEELMSLHLVEDKEQVDDDDSIEFSELQLPSDHYLIQTSNGDIIQALKHLDQDSGRGALSEGSLVEGILEHSIPEHVESNNNGVQILVVGTNSEEDIYLISTQDKDVESNESRNSLTSLTLGMKDDSLLEDSALTCVQELSSREQCLSPITVQNGPLIKNKKVPYEDILQQDLLPAKNTGCSFRQQSCKDLDNFAFLPEESQLNSKSLPCDLPLRKNNHQKLQKEILLPHTKTTSEYLEEGALVRTKRGDMVAYNLSTLAKMKEPNRHSSKLQDIASVFGSSIKVLRPIEAKKELSPGISHTKLSVFNCSECRAVLHSERSLENHQRKYHREGEEECCICGEKFLNAQYVRSHIEEVHSGQESYQCRLCSFKCNLVKDLYRHHRSHRKSKSCKYCGKKYITVKLFQKHTMRCRERREFQSPLENKNSDKEIICLRTKLKNGGNDDFIDKMTMNESSDRLPVNNKLPKSTDQKVLKSDDEFRFETKHYIRQARKIAKEHVALPVQRLGMAGRERTHRCYLCFKLFPTSKALETHKENYHLSKSEKPIRVKTDAALHELDESAENIPKLSLHCDLVEEVIVKEEPVELSEDCDNLTIIVDEAVNTHIVQPLCAICKTHTSVDFRQHSKWLSQIPDNVHCDTLKEVQEFVPCSFDIASLVEPWILCRKCAVLIDKIGDMQKKLSTMKSNLLLRVRGNSETNSNSDKTDVFSKCDSRGDAQIKFLNTLMDKDSKEIEKHLTEEEAFMNDSCEIMEIIRPQKGPGRPKKYVEEKFTPVLVEGKCNGETMVEAVDSVSPCMVKNVNIIVDTTSKLVEQKEDSKSSSNGKSHKKTEQYEFKSDNRNSGPGSLEIVTMHNQNSQFQDTGVGIEKRDQSVSLSPSSEIIQRNCQRMHKTSSQNETFDTLGRDIQDGAVKRDERCDTPETLDSRELEERDEALHDALQNFEEYEKCSNDENFERASVTFHITEDMETDDQKSDEVFTKMERKRVNVEERRKMCYKVSEASPKPWRCKECYKSFSSERGACDHYAASHKGENYACDQCNVSYVRKRALIGHYNKVHFNIKPYKCKQKECVETFSTHGQLYQHIKSVHKKRDGDTRHECDVCGASFSEKRYRDAHLPGCISKSSSNEPYECMFCNKTFKLSKQRQLHMRTVHWKGDQFYCEICNKILTDKKNLVIHMKSHLGQTKVKCEYCNKEFNRKSYLMTHMRVHTDHRPYKCNYCSKSFSQYSTWKNHERTHTGEKPYKCEFCSANFTTSSSLSKHIRYTHFSIRDFACDICEKKFISKAKMEDHFKVHTGEKPYKCQVCHRAFNKNNNLRTHMYVHSTNKKYKCNLCGEGFMRKSTIQKHMLERHKLEITMSCNTKSSDGDTLASMFQFISTNKADVPSEDSYIVVFADDNEELNDPKEMQVTVLAEDDSSNQTGISATNVSSPPYCRAALDGVDSIGDVLSEVILDASGRSSDELATLISKGGGGHRGTTVLPSGQDTVFA